ncbi:MAG: DUF5652 family protein [Candidatus Saccharimonadales bacterium]
MQTLSASQLYVLLVLILWSTVWKYLALWRAGTNRDIKWFIFFCIFNTLGFIEILYLYFLDSGRPKHSKKAVKASFNLDK